jgi:adenylosuccinate synthase
MAPNTLWIGPIPIEFGASQQALEDDATNQEGRTAMTAVVVVGAQWGDEGKGKIVDIYSKGADQVVRYAGGANAGHTLVVEGKQVVMHLVPAGVLHADKQCILSQGVVVDPEVLLNELQSLQSYGLFDPKRMLISERAFLVLPHHMLVDGLRDQLEGGLGTTRRGIGPAYEDKVGRRGLRVGDLLFRDRFARKLSANLEAWRPVIDALGGELPDADGLIDRYMEYGRRLAPLIGDSATVVRNALREGKRVLLEGNQGALLDLDCGTYPFVTSTSTTSGGACAGSGIGPTDIATVVGISKAYATRVGNGPFPTEITGEAGDALREAGAEFGATTGRPRRCGWLDLPALRWAVQINGLSGLALTKIDVLTGMKEIKVCTGYQLDGQQLSLPPYEEMERVIPTYETFAGWEEPLQQCRRLEDLPVNARRYLDAIEKAVECPIWLVSVGADREQTIVLKDPFATSSR